MSRCLVRLTGIPALLAAGCTPPIELEHPIEEGPPGLSEIGAAGTPPPAERDPTDIEGTLEGVTVWTAAEGPYRIHGKVIVPEDGSLTIEAGSLLWFEEGAELAIRGQLRAEGDPGMRITMTADPEAAWVPDFHPSLPDGPPRWDGVHFEDSVSPDNLLSHVDIAYAQSEDGAVGVVSSEVVLEHLVITGTRMRMIYTNFSTVIVRDSVFPAMFAEEDSALELELDNMAEMIKGVGGIPADGHFRIVRNVFGSNKGHNDVVDVTSGTWPGPLLEVRDNVFLGGGDEAIDGGGDVLLDGNQFYGFVKDADNDGSGDSNALSTGDELPTVVVATRNVYVGLDHVVNLKNDSFGYFEHNTVVGISPSRPSLPSDEPARILESSAIRLLIPSPFDPAAEPPRDPAGRGAYLEGNVFADLPEQLFGNPDENGGLGPHTSWLEVVSTLVPSADVLANADGLNGRTFDALVGEPTFVDPTLGDYRLAAGSVGVGAGRHGLDLGADVPPGATVCCVPAVTGPQVTFEVGGPGIFSYVWRVDGGRWSDDVVIGEPGDYAVRASLVRSASSVTEPLDAGAHLLEVRGRDFAGVLQDEPTAVWFEVDPTL